MITLHPTYLMKRETIFGHSLGVLEEILLFSHPGKVCRVLDIKHKKLTGNLTETYPLCRRLIPRQTRSSSGSGTSYFHHHGSGRSISSGWRLGSAGLYNSCHLLARFPGDLRTSWGDIFSCFGERWSITVAFVPSGIAAQSAQVQAITFWSQLLPALQRLHDDIVCKRHPGFRC